MIGLLAMKFVDGFNVNDIDQARKLMRKTIDLFKTQLVGMDDNVNESLISTVKIRYCGQPTPLEHLGLVSQQDRRINITLYDPTMINKVVEKLSDQGFNAYKFSKTTVVINIPLACGTNKQRVLAQIKKLGEDAKVSIRNIRRKFRKRNEDNNQELQTITNAAIKEVDDQMGVG